LIEHNSSTQAAIITDYVNVNFNQLPRCLFLTYGKPKLSQGQTTRIPGIRTTTSTKSSMVEYIRLAINPMPLVNNYAKLYFKAGLKKQFCHYKKLAGQRDADIPNVYDSLLAQMARFKKKVEMRNGNLIITFSGKPEKDDLVLALGLSFLVAYTLIARNNAIARREGALSDLSWSEICETIHPSDLKKPEYINQIHV
jgi:hypothetical protein